MKGKFRQATTSISVINFLSSGLQPLDSEQLETLKPVLTFLAGGGSWTPTHQHRLQPPDSYGLWLLPTERVCWGFLEQLPLSAEQESGAAATDMPALLPGTLHSEWHKRGSEGVLDRGKTKTNPPSNQEWYQISFKPFQAVRWYLTTWKSFSSFIKMKIIYIPLYIWHVRDLSRDRPLFQRTYTSMIGIS